MRSSSLGLTEHIPGRSQAPPVCPAGRRELPSASQTHCPERAANKGRSRKNVRRTAATQGDFLEEVVLLLGPDDG